MDGKTIRLLALIVPAMLAFPATAQAEERVCAGPIGAETVDNLRVPQNASCVLSATRVQGTAKVEAGATLRATAVVVIGNVQAENAALVTVAGSSIGGSVQIKQGGAADVSTSTVTGDIQYEHNTRLLNASHNTVRGNVQVVGNGGGASVFRNTIDGNLQCKENSPAPVGGGNLVRGDAEDQCAGFGGGKGADAAGLTVPDVSADRTLSRMQPFPRVRIAGRTSRRGAHIRVLSVRAQPGAYVRVKCLGRSCPFDLFHTLVGARVRADGALPRTALVRVRRLEGRLLRAGSVLRVFVSSVDHVGKYTRFRIRRAKRPLRRDGCILPDSLQPLSCPSI